MSEETTNDGAGEGNEPAGGAEPTAIELKARDAGWRPLDEFNGDPDEWVDAGEFVRRGPLFKALETKNKELKAIRETLAQFQDHHSKVQENAYKKALVDLKAKKKEALIEGDADLVVEIDEQLQDVKMEQAAKKQQPAQREPTEEHPEFVAFKQKNSWYETAYPMRRWADARGEELAREGRSPSDVLRTIEREVREEFPKRFENPNRSRPNSVESGTQRGSTSAKAYQPNEIEEKLAARFVREGLYKNKQEYYAELAEFNKG